MLKLSVRAWLAALRAPVRVRLVDDWRRAAKAWSTWAAGAGVALWGIITQFPMVASEAWNAVPADLREMLPHRSTLALVLFGAIFVLRFMRQGKPDA